MGLRELQRRQLKLKVWSVLISTVMVVSLVGVLMQHDFVYGFFGLTQQIEQMHLPIGVDATIQAYSQQTDYFIDMLVWVAWFLFKIVTAFIGAFVLIGILKKIRYFAVRFQSFVLKFVGWLIAFIVIWSGATLIQYNLNDDQDQSQYELVHYDQHIRESLLYQMLQSSDTDEMTRAYVLAQTALLHKPADLGIATNYITQLVKAERTEANFIEYGFKPEQLRAMQMQVYGKAVTPLTVQLSNQVEKADKISNIFEKLLVVVSLVTLVLSLILYFISNRLNKRALRIQQQLLNLRAEKMSCWYLSG